ncbi:MAG: haloacid dehalogenase type II [Proteobacteria bacterium]|nr:haloacid dehalogenase type II [Pseudomonadota bacterium]
MPISRRTLLGAGMAAASGASLAVGSARADAPLLRYRAIAFDAFPIFDPAPVAARVESFFPAVGGQLMNLWRTRQFEYTWLRTISGRYRDFMSVTEDALVFAAAASGVTLSSQQRDDLLQLYLQLPGWPDAKPVLRRLKAAGARLALLSNFTPAMLDGGITASNLGGVFEQVLSTDLARTYKPDQRAYQLGVEAFGVPRQQILFVAFAGWDAAGAKAFGYPTFWVNRQGLPSEELDATPDGAGRTLAELAEFLGI